jgi:hypothetical protein
MDNLGTWNNRLGVASSGGADLKNGEPPRDAPIWKLEAARNADHADTAVLATGAHDPAHRGTADGAVRMGSS